MKDEEFETANPSSKPADNSRSSITLQLRNCSSKSTAERNKASPDATLFEWHMRAIFEKSQNVQKIMKQMECKRSNANHKTSGHIKWQQKPLANAME